MKRFRKSKISTKQVVLLGTFLVGLLGFMAYFWKDEIFDLASKASSRNASLVINVSESKKRLVNVWGNIAQGGEDLRGNMLAPVAAQLKALSPKTVRIDHIYDGYEVVRREGGGLMFDWTRLDEVVKSITAAGARPMLSLSYMPLALSNGDITGMPNDWNEWSLVVQRTVEHYSRDLGIHGVIYEVWNEPDLFGGFKSYGDKNYLTLYGYAVAGASRASGVKPYEIGGPAITAFYKAWMENFFKYVTDNNVRVDFVSWHRYDTNLDVFDRDIRHMQIILRKYRNKMPKDIKVYLTETGPDSDNNPSYDRQSGAAHLVAVTAVGIERGVDGIYTFELVDGKDPAGQQQWGRWGMLTHPEMGLVEKPRYTAMQWLNRLSGWELAVNGQGSWVKAIATKNTDNGYQLLMANYDDYNSHSENVPVSLLGLEPGSYSLSKEYFGKGKSNETVSVGDNGLLNFEVGLTPNQIVYLELLKN